MRGKPVAPKVTKPSAEKIVKDIRRETRRHFSAEEKIRIVLECLRGEDSISEVCRREGIATSLYYSWSKEFLDTGKKRPPGDVRHLRKESRDLEIMLAGRGASVDHSTIYHWLQRNAPEIER